MSTYTRKTTIEQVTARDDDGTPHVRLLTVVTEHALPDLCSDDEREEIQAFVDGLHDAKVALEQLEPEHRERANAWLDERDVDAADETLWIERAIEATSSVLPAR